MREDLEDLKATMKRPLQSGSKGEGNALSLRNPLIDEVKLKQKRHLQLSAIGLDREGGGCR